MPTHPPLKPGADPEKKSVRKPGLPLLFLLLAIVAVLWGVSGFFLFPDTDRGTFGDMFGAVNALFSGLAFAGLIYTILIQRQELSGQQLELRRSRIQFKAQTRLLTEQNKALRDERHERTFFQLLAFQHEIVDAVRVAESRESGRACFQDLWRRLGDGWNDSRRREPGLDPGAALNKVYENFYFQYQSAIGHYLRSLGEILSYIASHAELQSSMYPSLVRSQLSSHELLIIMYHGLSAQAEPGFKKLLEAWSILENTPRGVVLHDAHLGLYTQSAFSSLAGKQ
jgi:hypothetical protein